MKIKFIERRVVQDAGQTVFEKGKVYDLPEDSARHWLSRGAATVVSTTKPAAKKPAQ